MGVARGLRQVVAGDTAQREFDGCLETHAMAFAVWVAAMADRAVAWSISRYNHLYSSCCTRVGPISVSVEDK